MALLVSLKGRDAQPFHEGNGALERSTWEDSSLRAWLNNDFLSAAFDSADRQALCASGDSGTDLIFLLSEEEADMLSDDDLLCEASRYAQRTRLAALNNNHGSWWLRSPASGQTIALTVSAEGGIGETQSVNAAGVMVRPACLAAVSALTKAE